MADLQLTTDERAVLLSYGRGADIERIVAETELTRDVVSSVVMDRAGMDRGRARQLVLDHERRSQAAPPAKPADGVEQLLADAEGSGVARLKAKAERIRGQVAELRDALAATAAERTALAEVAAARKALDVANAKLRRARTAPAKATQDAASPSSKTGARAAGLDSKVVRAWAIDNGVECGPIGRVPQPVIDQYLAAREVA